MHRNYQRLYCTFTQRYCSCKNVRNSLWTGRPSTSLQNDRPHFVRGKSWTTDSAAMDVKNILLILRVNSSLFSTKLPSFARFGYCRWNYKKILHVETSLSWCRAQASSRLYRNGSPWYLLMSHKSCSILPGLSVCSENPMKFGSLKAYAKLSHSRIPDA